MRLALTVLGVTLFVAGAGWLWALLKVPPAVHDLTVWGGAAAAVLLSAAAAAVTYFAEAARQARWQVVAVGADAKQLKRELSELAVDTVPLLVAHLRDGAGPEAVFGQIRPPASEELRGLLGILVQEIAAAGG